MHTHCTCEHQLKYCSHCDIVYCEKCGKEWKVPATNWTYVNPLCNGGTTTLPYVGDNITYTVSC